MDLFFAERVLEREILPGMFPLARRCYPHKSCHSRARAFALRRIRRHHLTIKGARTPIKIDRALPEILHQSRAPKAGQCVRPPLRHLTL